MVDDIAVIGNDASFEPFDWEGEDIGYTSVLGVLGSGRPNKRPMTSMGLPPFLTPFSTPERQWVIIFMTAEGEMAVEVK